MLIKDYEKAIPAIIGMAFCEQESKSLLSKGVGVS